MESSSIGKSALLTDLAMCLNHYRMQTPGLYACLHVQVALSAEYECVPDFIMTINRGKFKQCNPDYANDAFVGPPNFVLDVSDEIDSMDHIERKNAFEKYGVGEYLFISNPVDLQFAWYSLGDDGYEIMQPDENGLYKSRALPGLWVSEAALLSRDWWTILANIDRGVSRRGHHDLMRTIWPKP